MTERNINLLIVDDEAEIREGINRSIPWKDHGIVVTGLATNGREALHMIAETKPDIMILDIRMPVMNGLQVLEELAEQKSIPKIVILSGYDDFGYCRQALRGGVAEYLLKPSRPKEILEVIIKLKEQVLTEERQAGEWEYLQKQFRENFQILREKLLIDLVQNEPIDRESGLIRWNLYEMEVSPQNIGIALVRIDHLKKLTHASRKEQELTKLAVRNFIKKYIKQSPALQSVISDYHDDLLILWNLNEENIECFSLRMEQLRQGIEAETQFTVTIGIGEPAEDFSKLYSAFNSALLALEHGFWEGTNRLIRYIELETDNTTSDLAMLQEENHIIHSIRTNDTKGLEPALESFFSSLIRRGGNSRDYMQKMIIMLVCSIYHICIERGINTDLIFGPNLAILDELPQFETLNELKQKIHACLALIIELHPLHKNQWKVVSQAINYIEEHYAEDLSLEAIARQVFVSPGYLSTIFKQVLQKNFIEYLSEIRIKYAKELLRDFHLKIYEVAIQIGYKDEKYFSQIFKKITGMTPNQYRDSINNHGR